MSNNASITVKAAEVVNRNIWTRFENTIAHDEYKVRSLKHGWMISPPPRVYVCVYVCVIPGYNHNDHNVS